VTITFNYGRFNVSENLGDILQTISTLGEDSNKWPLAVELSDVATTDDRTTLTFLVTMRSQQDADVYIPLLNEDTVKALKQRLTPPSPNMPPPPQPPLPGTPVVNDIVFESSDTGFDNILLIPILLCTAIGIALAGGVAYYFQSMKTGGNKISTDTQVSVFVQDEKNDFVRP